MSIAMKGKKLSAKHREAISKGGMGRKQTPESIKKTRAASLGRKHTPETKAKMRLAWEHRQRKQTPEHIAKCNVGRALTQLYKKQKANNVLFT
jgi:hypothetical protein